MKIAIVGAGVWGLSCAKACAQRGMQVAVYDETKIGSGASGGVVGALSPYTPDEWHPKKQFQFEALDSAAPFWAEVDALSGQNSGYGRIGRLQPLLTERTYALALKRSKTAQDFWQGKYAWNVLNRPDFMPQAAAPFGVVHDTFSARLSPERAVQSLALACKKIGVSIYEHHRVDSVQSGKIMGKWGEATADAIILAGGYNGFDLIDKMLPHPSKNGAKGQAAVLEADLTGTPQIYAEGVYFIPHENRTVAIGSTSEKQWDTGNDTDALLDELVARARSIHPALNAAPVLKRWAGVRPKARRQDPMLGEIPGYSGVFCAAGGYKIGFGLAPKIGEVLRRMVEGEVVELPRTFTVNWHMAEI